MRNVEYIFEEDGYFGHLVIRETFEQEITLDLNMAIIRLEEVDAEIRTLENTIETLRRHRDQLALFIENIQSRQEEDQNDGDGEGED